MNRKPRLTTGDRMPKDITIRRAKPSDHVNVIAALQNCGAGVT